MRVSQNHTFSASHVQRISRTVLKGGHCEFVNNEYDFFKGGLGGGGKIKTQTMNVLKRAFTYIPMHAYHLPVLSA